MWLNWRLRFTFHTWQKWGFCVFACLWMFLVGGGDVHRYANTQILQMIFNHTCSPAQFQLINWYTDIGVLFASFEKMQTELQYQCLWWKGWQKFASVWRGLTCQMISQCIWPSGPNFWSRWELTRSSFTRTRCIWRWPNWWRVMPGRANMICDQSPFLVLKQTFQVIVPRKHNSRAEMMPEVGPQAKDQSYSFKNILI